MQAGSISSVAYRNGDWGPAYLLEGGTNDLGVLKLRPGDAMPNHLHRRCDESFIVLEGRATLWTDATDRHEMTVDTVHRCTAGEMHYLVNDSDADFRCIFIKTPSSPGDTVIVDWSPGQQRPTPPDLAPITS